MLRRHVRTQVLWNATSVAWPSEVANRALQFRTDNTFVDAAASFNAMAVAPNALLGPVVLSNREAYVDIIFAGRVTGVTTNTLQSADQGLYVVARGELQTAINNEDSGGFTDTNGLLTHPVGEQSKTLEDTFERSGWVQDGLAVLTPKNTANAAGSVRGGVLVQTDWPFSGNNHAVDERWYMVFPVTRLKNYISTVIAAAESAGAGGGAETDITGYRRLWFEVFYIMPASVVGIDAPSFDGVIAANIYESMHP